MVAIAFFAVGIAPTASVQAQQGAPPSAAPSAVPNAPPQTAAAHFAAVTADNVYVRSGPSVQSSYPFGKLDRNRIVRVVEENFGWSRVQTAGAAFRDMSGFVLADDRVQLSADGGSITATAVTELRAPNIGADSSPDSSWKQIGRVDAGTTLIALNRVDGERGSVWRVRLPTSGEGWINSSFLRAATAAEAAAFEAPQPGAVLATASLSDASGEPSEPGAAIEVAGVEIVARGPSPEAIASQKRRATFADLEATWLKVKGQAIEEAELGAMFAAYTVLVADPACEPGIKARAHARTEQLEVQQVVQGKLVEIRNAKARLSGECDQIESVAKAIEARSDYAAVGVLNASIVYDGATLPLLFRLQDPASGQTVAYVVPDDSYQLSTMLGTLIGIRGERCFDDALKLDTITPSTIDYLTPKSDD